MSRNDSNNYINDFNSPNSNFLNTNSSANTPFTSDSATTNFHSTNNNTNNNSDNNIPYNDSIANFGYTDNVTNIDNTTNANFRNLSSNQSSSNQLHDLSIDDLEKDFLDNIFGSLQENGNNINNINNINNTTNINSNINDNDNNNSNNNININTSEINFNSVPLDDKNFSMNTANNYSTNTDSLNLNGVPIGNNNFSINTINSSNNTDSLNSVYQSPQPLSLVRDSSSLKTETFSPQSLGFSTNFTSHKLGKSLSNSLAKSYGSQLGTSFNSLISPSSNYDDFLDSPYGSYNETDNLKSPLNSPPLKSFVGSPSSVNTHLNPKSALSKETKLSRRRELHNAVERRRRDLIKEKIKELGTLIPPSMLYESKYKNSTKDVKANKNIILNKSVSYIIYLKEILDAQDKKLIELEEQIEKLNLNNSPVININDEKNENINNNYINDNSNTYNNNNNFENYNYTNNSNNETSSTINNSNNETSSTINNSNNNNKFGNDPKLEDFQNKLSAFTDDINIRPSESKLNFMDFSNNHSEPLDFKKLTETFKEDPTSTCIQNNNNNINNNNNNNNNTYNTPDDMDLLLNLDQINSNDENYSNENYNRVPFNYNKENITSPGYQIKSETNDDFDRLLNSDPLQFKSDAEFLDHILSKKPVDGFGL